MKTISKTETTIEDEGLLFEILKNIKEEEQSLDLERFFEVSIDMICIAGTDGYLKQISKSFERTLGYTSEELLSKPFEEFEVQIDYERTTDLIFAIVKGNLSLNNEKSYYCKDRSVKHLAWSSVSIPEENIIYAIARDVTAQKDAEKKLKEHTQKLEMYAEESLQSLRYARSLQEAIFPDSNSLVKIFPDSFIYHAPKHIVSGDFFWFDHIENNACVAVADCTGHGVPGAILSVMGVNVLNTAFTNEPLISPLKMLNKLDIAINNMLTRKNGEKVMNDGMDIAMISIDRTNNVLDFAGANNPLYIVRGDELFEYKSDKYNLGSCLPDKIFSSQKIALLEGDMVYLFSDGIADQFGGEFGKKFGYKRFRELLLSIQSFEAEQQKTILAQTMDSWRGELEQTDDILVMGIKIKQLKQPSLHA